MDSISKAPPPLSRKKWPLPSDIQRIEEWEKAKNEENLEEKSGSDRGAREEGTTEISVVAVIDI